MRMRAMNSKIDHSTCLNVHLAVNFYFREDNPCPNFGQGEWQRGLLQVLKDLMGIEILHSRRVSSSQWKMPFWASESTCYHLSRSQLKRTKMRMKMKKTNQWK